MPRELSTATSETGLARSTLTTSARECQSYNPILICDDQAAPRAAVLHRREERVEFHFVHAAVAGRAGNASSHSSRKLRVQLASLRAYEHFPPSAECGKSASVNALAGDDQGDKAKNYENKRRFAVLGHAQRQLSQKLPLN